MSAQSTLTEVVTPKLGYQYLLDFGFTTLVDGTDENYPGKTDIIQSMALGGITRGVYNLEMTAAYAAIANGGKYIEPILYTQVLDHDGNVLLDNTTPDTRQVLKDSTAYLLTSAMEDVVTGSGGTGGTARMSNMPVAAKTGTSQESNDLWILCFHTVLYSLCLGRIRQQQGNVRTEPELAPEAVEKYYGTDP